MEREVTAARRLEPLERRKPDQGSETQARKDERTPQTKSPLPLPRNDKAQRQRGQNAARLYCKDHQSVIIVLMKP